MALRSAARARKSCSFFAWQRPSWNHAAALLGVDAASCLYIGDAERDVQSARAAGMSVLVASYGYLGDEDDTHAWQPDGHIAAPLDVLAWLQET